MDSGTRITDGGSEYAAILAHAEGVLYGTELGSVTLKRMCVFYYCRTYYKAVRVGGEESRGHVL